MPSRVDQLRNETRSVSSVSTASSDATAVDTPVGLETLYLYLYPGAELPSVPYKLRFAISPDEWDSRIQIIAEHTNNAARPLPEAIYFFICCIAIPAGIGYPLFMQMLDFAEATRKGKGLTKQDGMIAIIISSVVALLLFMIFSTPLFVRKYILQRRMNRVTQSWEAIDQKKADKNLKLKWRVRLPYLFGSASALRIPVPPRTEGSGRTLIGMHAHSRSNSSTSSWESDMEAQGGGSNAGSMLARDDSFGGQSVFTRNS
ncbi:SubName: Full=Uncharacterized protein {ECO:0000313/EMBL:CCA69288.1} [Serendipita indica DSM 11827]|uniref:Uncharacterized protein n=1 Tax=Serendipita indica (strain DSM 11827) TaxID=1109443 RepID=G4TD75_SERID|nr:SubName: Full=Uncharacterized protein {ECO:0000313/EMBL:CCA69288.1} [Serendipita indica DSM 11827]CCA69288.1 hypothetical protein PIIN_03187 [Serendipita indica DSM 11827]